MCKNIWSLVDSLFDRFSDQVLQGSQTDLKEFLNVIKHFIEKNVFKMVFIFPVNNNLYVDSADINICALKCQQMKINLRNYLYFKDSSKDFNILGSPSLFKEAK
jgi:hypothetical protein